MSVEIVMPQMGESITEGTVSKWLKSVGDTVEKDEAILEISTDKVDAEVPSSGAGVLLEIRHQEGETVEVGTVLAIVGEAGEPVSSPTSQASSEPVETPKVEEVKPPEPVVEAPKVEAVSSPPSAIPTSQSDATEIVMPQMGESITEGTISKWLKNVGDAIEKDEPILEISTDKVDAEVPSSAAGTLLEIRHQEGETVEVGTVLALVGSGSGVSISKAEVPSQTVEAPKVEPVKEEAKPVEIPQVKTATAGVSATPTTLESLRQTKSSPLVRNIAKEHGIDISKISGTGLSGRVTKSDILNFLDTGAAVKPEDLLVKPITPVVSTPQTVSTPQVAPVTAPVSKTATVSGDRVETMSNMRKRIAEHMTFSKQTSAHVTSVYEIDMTNVVKFREKNKAAFAERFGTKLTYMPFIFQAVTQALRKYPIINSQVDGDKIIYKGDINLGMAVALDWGLIVPVIRKADTLSLSGLTITANDLAERARSKKLNPDEVQGGTFTITNTGTFGGLFGTPIINQPQVAILNFGTIEKRAKVLTSPDGDDYIAIRSMAYFALTYDHRIVDGSDGEKFLSFVQNYLETNQFSL
ncbi:MAG TPA: 2-oxoglutarate dehydrogenase, E2 component, dihydrolipoamide succinyltransferase [Pyrinomonadaceae bacterium]|nr:2-oxoglutarate dehydrogenase, E2 component, dihydrolipoamide succinyltransferase [Pyrinomonadaceae bacterium]